MELPEGLAVEDMLEFMAEPKLSVPNVGVSDEDEQSLDERRKEKEKEKEATGVEKRDGKRLKKRATTDKKHFGVGKRPKVVAEKNVEVEVEGGKEGPEGEDAAVGTEEERRARGKALMAEVRPGVASVAQRARDPVVEVTEPEGDEGWCFLDIRSQKGWLQHTEGKRSYPSDCFKAFNLPQDMELLRAKSSEQLADGAARYLGKFMAHFGQLYNMARDYDMVEKAKQNELRSYQLSQDVKNDQKKIYERSEQEKADLQAQLNKARSEKEDMERNLGKKEEENTLLKQEVERLKGAVAEKDDALKAVRPETEVIASFKESEEYRRTLAASKTQIWSAGFDSTIQFVGVGNVVDVDKHTKHACLLAAKKASTGSTK